MPRHFNTAGPCRPDWHYMIPAERRLPEAESLVEQAGYFVVHAPRQSGKTTALRALAAQLTAAGRYAVLTAWARSCPRPLVLFFDEIDALRGQSLISVLRQLRDGFPHRPTFFPASVILCGLRDVRDDKAASGGNPERMGTSSPTRVPPTWTR